MATSLKTLKSLTIPQLMDQLKSLRDAAEARGFHRTAAAISTKLAAFESPETIDWQIIDEVVRYGEIGTQPHTPPIDLPD